LTGLRDALTSEEIPGRLKARQEIQIGLEKAFASTVDLHRVANLGKLMVQVEPDAA
jgi:NADPH-dependent curcumin reductase CurA